MSVDRNELHELVDALPDDQLPAAGEILRRRVEPRTARTTEPFAWMGAGETKDGLRTKVISAGQEGSWLSPWECFPAPSPVFPRDAVFPQFSGLAARRASGTRPGPV